MGIHQRLKKKLLFVTTFLLALYWTSIPVYATEETTSAVDSTNNTATVTTYDTDIVELPASGWKQDSVGWWYQYEDGSYPTNKWEYIYGNYYWFDGKGYMATGWRKISGKWQYFELGSGHWIDSSKYSKYENGTIKGVDVSAWQGTIDWNKVKAFGIDYAFIRLGHSKDAYTVDLDTYFHQNMNNAYAAGIPVGVYYYSKATTEQQAVREAQFVIDNITGHTVSYPIAFDLEDSSQQGLSKTELGKIAKAFCDEIKRAGYTPMIYMNEYWYKNCVDMSYLAGIERWIARYSYHYDESITRGIWQCGSTGRVSGISGNVDIDFSYKDYTKIVTPRTKPVSGYVKFIPGWKSSSYGWWYQNMDGSYPANKWEYIDNKWYWFNSSGYMTTGWQYVGNTWYYMNGSGARQTGWQYLGRTWYYLDKNGAMLTGWQNINGIWYYMNSSGAMLTGWVYSGGKWYYLNRSGAMTTGWQYIGGNWYYMNGSGAMHTGWLQIGNTWYYLYPSGKMAVGRCRIGGRYYYFNSSGRWQS